MSNTELHVAIKEVLGKERFPLTGEQVCHRLHFDREQYRMLKSVLNEMVHNGEISRAEKDKYASRRATDLLEGTVCGTASGSDFFMCADLGHDLRIRHSLDFGVLHGDRVLVRPAGTCCQVVQVLERKHPFLVGTLYKDGHSFLVQPDEKKLHCLVRIPRNERMGAQEGQKVVVAFSTYPTARTEAVGRITEILGDSLDPDAAVLSVLRSYGVRESFPEEVLAEAEGKTAITEQELDDRLDLRKLKTITIDGDDAKDLDDAVSLEKTENGDYLLGVHIADVSHYVIPGSALNKEAEERGTSVYIPGRVFPMLPQALSNGLCSLNPGEDKLTLSCFMVIGSNGEVKEYSIQPSVIRSCERMTYHNVTELLETPQSPLQERYEHILSMLQEMEQLARLLRRVRSARGSIDFDIPEAKILLDEQGHAIDVRKYEITVSNSMIEEFMLKANETVAYHMQTTGLPAMYRIHQAPSGDKKEAFAVMVKIFGYSLPLSPKPLDYSNLLRAMEGKPEKPMLARLMLRSMSKARYSAVNEGHFGLAAANYLHFTSPIRRYPDLIVHRILHFSFENNEAGFHRVGGNLVTLSQHCSDCEVNAALAERNVDDLKKAEYMVSRIGEIYPGIISGVTSFGLYVELENTVEGFIPLTSLEDDEYVFDEAAYRLLGQRTRKQYQLGNSLSIRVVSADQLAGLVRFLPADT